MTYRILNKTKGTVIANKAAVAGTFFKRLIGLMFRKSIGLDEALIFYRAPSIHMFFMRFSIDVVFLDKDMRVIETYSGLKPWRLTAYVPSSVTIELPARKTGEILTEKGDILEFIPC